MGGARGAALLPPPPRAPPILCQRAFCRPWSSPRHGDSRRFLVAIRRGTREPFRDEVDPDPIPPAPAPSEGRCGGKISQGPVYGLLGVLDVLQPSGQIGVVGGHVKVPVPGEAKEDGPALAPFLAGQGLVDGSPDGMGRLGRR